MPIVDAHPHIYSPDRGAYPTIPEPWEPGEPASAEDLKQMMDVVGVDRAVFIQTSTFYGHDNRYVMDSAKKHADWAAGVVTLDPDDASHPDLLADAVKNSNIRGMRGTADSIGRISSPDVYRLWTRAMELGIPVNCMVMDELELVPEIERIAQDLGDLKIVIDHCFMLNTRQRTEETLLALERLARLPNIYAKLTSGTHGSYRVYPYVDMHGPLKRVIEAFGPGRCVWGSNFPNTLWSKGATYAQNLHLFVKELGLSLPDKADILGGTAMALWFPKEQAEDTRRARAQSERTEREVILAQDAGSDQDAEDEDGTSEEAVRAAEVTNIADLLAAQDGTPAKMAKTGRRRAGGEAEDGEADGGADMAAILDVANQLSAMLGPAKGRRSTRPVQAEEPEDEPELETMSDEMPADEPAAPNVVVNVMELLAAQNYTPIKTDEIGQPEPDEDGDVDLDVSGLMDVANQLNSMLESVDKLATDAADIADELMHHDGAGETGANGRSASA